jgi:serine/threonine protein phosphatase 1
MFRLFRQPAAATPAAVMPTPRAQTGRRVYAVGDCHGRADLMREMIALIDAEQKKRPAAETIEIILGDFIDRGPDSRGVIDLLLTPPDGRRRIVLGGNHEECMVRFLDDPTAFAQWRNLGGYPTLLSYGVKLRPAATPSQLDDLAREAADAIPESHKAFLRATELYHVENDFLFVHAGIRPGVPLRAQAPDDLRWIREPFLSWQGDFGYHVVHGHTPVIDVDARPNRTNIDTSAFSSGKLSCLVIEEDRIEVLQTGPRPISGL